MQRQVLKINGAQCPFSGACFKIHTTLNIQSKKKSVLVHDLHGVRIHKKATH